MKYKSTLLRIGRSIGVFYTTGRRKNTIVVYAGGAPSVPDNGGNRAASTILRYKTDLFVPDYIGFGRSEGTFTPINCVKTLLSLYDSFSKGRIGVNHRHEGERRRLKYKRIIFIGSSFGGRYVPMLPKFNNKINEIGIFYPALDTSLYGTTKRREESNKEFLNAMKYDGYHHLYRGILSKSWIKHLQDRDALAPRRNLKYLKDTKLFIAHGRLDKTINFSRSVSYYKEIRRMFPNKDKSTIKLKLYKKGEHSGSVTRYAARDFLNWLKVKKEK